jgi:basic membrane protein A
MYKNLAATLVAACFLPPATQAAPPPQTRSRPRGSTCHANYRRRLDASARPGPPARCEKALGAGANHLRRERARRADAERVIRDLAAQGNQIIFTTSFGYMEPTLKVARDFPDVKFEVLTGYKRAPNVATPTRAITKGATLPASRPGA